LGMTAEKISESITDHIAYYARPEAKPLGVAHISLSTTAGTGH